MAKKEHQFRLYNRIWFLAISLVLFILTLWGAADSFLPAAMALEQETRCQMTEHVHTDECYVDTVLVCDQKAHTHSENCYLILLKDNDINTLLTAVDNAEDNSLEGVIQDTLTQAVAAEGVTTDGEEELTFVGGTEVSPSPSATPTPTPTPTPDPSPTTSRSDEDPQPSTTRESATDGDTGQEESTVAVLSLTGTSLTALNETIEEEEIDPGLTLNTNLYAAEAVAAELNSGVSTLAVGDSAGSANNTVYFYIELDEEITYIGSGTFSYNNGNNNNNRYYYIGYDDVVDIYTAQLITDLDADYIYSNNNEGYYFFRYGYDPITSENLDDLLEAGERNSTRLYLGGRNSGTASRYALLTTRSGSWYNYNYTPVPFWTVTLDYSAVGGTDEVQYVQDGLSSTLRLSDEYDWVNGNGNTVDASDLTNITGTTTLYARPRGNTVTFESNGGSTVAMQTIPEGGTAAKPADPTRAHYTFAGWYSDAALTTTYDFNTVVTGSITLYAKWTPDVHTITYYDSGGTLLYTDKADYGSSHTLRDAPDGQVWFSGDDIYAGTWAPVTGDLTLRAGVVATFNYIDGTTVRVPAAPGDTITLQALNSGSYWTDESGNQYNAGDSFVLTESMAFVESRSLILSYDVNFPTGGYDFYYSVSAPASSPTVYGMSGSTGSLTILPGDETTVRTVSQTIVRLETGHGQSFTYPVAFKGWESETGERISAHTRLSWQELQSYDENGDGTVELTGVWEHGRSDTVNFFILHHADVGSTSGAASDYTRSIYSTYMGNPDTSNTRPYTATNDAQALANDPLIRDMYGERADGMWFYTFPTDEEIFASLKPYAQDGTLTVEGVAVDVDDLNPNEYAIRWYQVIYDGGDGWHVDGKLVRKVGAIEVTKTFSGNETLIADAQNNFSITATNGTRTLTLNAANAVDDGDGNPNTWYWQITGVEYNEEWTLTESAAVTDTIHYAEWSVVDSSANSQTANGSGATVKVRGVTYASDLADPEWLQAGFNNIYYRANSLMIKKADGTTGEALSGAQFQLYQNGTRMTFDYDADTGLYEYNANGTGAYSTLTGDGYINIVTTGFSYETGPITVVESKAPANYNPVGSIVMGYTDDSKTTIGITNGVDYAQYHDGLLVVENSTNTRNVTAQKSWQCEQAEWTDVTVQLFANGSANLAATLTGGTPSVVTLTAANNYSYTWTGLPIYAYGAQVEWSIKETQIGDEACKADYTFANWAVSYDAPAYDSDGNVTLVVHNTPSRPLLFLTKTNADGSIQLAGAAFTLVQVDSNGVMADGFVPRTATTNERGVLIFDNLLYGARYRIVEEYPPPGYRPMTSPIYVTIAEGGAVTVESHTHARADAVAYNIVVTNDSYPPLPATGGPGTAGYTIGGAALLAAALLLLGYQKRKRGREVDLPDA